MKIQNLFFFCLLILTSCTEKILKEECPDMICTMEFRSVSVKFKDADGNPITVKDFSAVIKRTGAATQPGTIDPVNFKGIYSVVTDNDTKNLLIKGDTIVVSATHPQTNQIKTAQFVVKGGKCACHIEKVSGPEEIAFNSDIPVCIEQMIEVIKSEKVRNPAGSVWQYIYKDKTVYFIPQFCCDIPSKLIDSDCNVICSPDGGFTGKGDGKCTNFFTERKEGKLIWKDERK